MKIKTSALFFIIAEILDMLTTHVSILLGGTELNPIVISVGWGWATVIKLFAIIFVVYFIQSILPKIIVWNKFGWIYPTIAFVPVMLNINTIFQLST
jgi:hypothetical protein